MTSFGPTWLDARTLRGIACSALLATTGAEAALINVDFNTSSSGTYSGAAVVGSAGDTWNGVVAGTLGSPVSGSGLALNDAGGSATTATLSFTATSGAYSPVGCLLAANATAPLMCDYLYADSKTVTVTVAGLTPGELFDLILYSSANWTNRTTTFSLDGTTKTTTQQAVASLIEGTNYARYAGVVGASGAISFDVIGGIDGDTEGNLNGLQLTLTSSQVPEPAGIGLVIAGLAALAVRRRRTALT